MVLAQLGGSIARALAWMKGATVVDEKVLADCLNELSRALLQADVRFETVQDSRASSTSTRSPRAPTSAASYTRYVTYIYPIVNNPSLALSPYFGELRATPAGPLFG